MPTDHDVGRIALSRALPAMALLASACAKAPMPGPEILDRLEARLTAQPCIGNISQWNRSYQFLTHVGPDDPRRGEVDQNVVDFRLVRIPALATRGGRAILPPDHSFQTRLDGPPGPSAAGTYEIGTGRLNVHCFNEEE